MGSPFEGLTGAPRIIASLRGALSGTARKAKNHENATDGEERRTKHGDDNKRVLSARESGESCGETNHTERDATENSSAEHDENVELANAIGQVAASHLRAPVTDTCSTGSQSSAEYEDRLTVGKEVRGA